jgi:DNA repair protein RecO (recombination protein O)
MLEKTQGIVLHTLKYGDTSIIAHFYTREFGRQSFIINGIYSKKARFGPALFQPLNVLDMVIYFKPDRSINRIREMNSIHTLHESNPVKSSISLFITEILYKTLKEEVSNYELYDFLEHSIQLLHVSHDGLLNFHLLFLLEYSRFLGFNPTNNFSKELNKYFSPIDGKFCESVGNASCNLELSSCISALLNLKLSEGNQIKLNNSQRNALLKILIDYYLIHNDTISDIRSMAVLEEVFR